MAMSPIKPRPTATGSPTTFLSCQTIWMQEFSIMTYRSYVGGPIPITEQEEYP